MDRQVIDRQTDVRTEDGRYLGGRADWGADDERVDTHMDGG